MQCGAIFRVGFPALKQALGVSDLGQIFGRGRGSLTVNRLDQIKTTAMTAAASAATTASVAPATFWTAAALVIVYQESLFGEQGIPGLLP